MLQLKNQKNENQLIPDEIIMNKVYYIRGQKVMMDKDLAELYGTQRPRQLKFCISGKPQLF
jgi:hypothetical protein